MGNPELIKYLNDVKYSFNSYTMNRTSIEMGIASVEDKEYFESTLDKIKQTRAWTAQQLSRLGFTFQDSKANFIFAKSDKIGGEELYLKLKEKGVLIRHFKNDRIKEYNRITIGSIEEMQIFINSVTEILGE